ncbi:hypothetical protein D9758_018528 [Tetrapyrgos nigripes]|uniref:DUF6534 domain-containing protein n=1 Tax=Tetrapyrgos nigripes TaxID=182062 RepID=A0A8H5B8X7_9AGAR|nr:hypothetical protein D9758_018528 [Tetrapyrgos nigripes]
MSHAGDPFLLFTGPLFIGTILNWALLGGLTVQAYVYYNSRHRDSKWIQVLVATCIVLDIVQTIFATHSSWGILILGWGDPAALAAPPWTAYTFPVMCGIVAALIQIFFAWRIWILGRNSIAKAAAVLTALLALAQFIAGFVGSIKAATVNILDIGSLTPVFTLHSSKSNFGPTNNLIDQLMIRVIHSGAITAVAAGVELILYLTMSQTFVHDTPALFLGKLYSNVLLANLNTRQKNDDTYSSGVISSRQSKQTTSLPFMHFESRGKRSDGSATAFHDLESSDRGRDIKVSTSIIAVPR